MSKVSRLTLLCLVFAAGFLQSQPAIAKKKPDEPAAAPIPIQIATAKKVFISYGVSDADPGAPNLTYNEFYALMKDWGKYELMRAPADADLVFDIHFVSGITDAQLWMTIIDPKTGVTLWPFVQHVDHSSQTSARRKKFDEAMEDLIGDLKQLTASAAAQ